MRNFHDIKHDRYYAGSHYPTERHDVYAIVICPGCATTQKHNVKRGKRIHISPEMFYDYKQETMNCHNCGITFGATEEDKKAYNAK